MAAAPCYSTRVDQALALAAEAFRDRRRKGTDIPYLSHLLQVMVHVAEHGGDEDQLIAALLHDYLEDIEGTTEAELSRQFGPRVAGLVAGLSDATSRPKPPWRARKQAYLVHLASASPDLKLISAADKLHNAHAIRRDLGQVGELVWQRFQADRDQVLWYYRELVTALESGWQHPLLEALRAEVAALCRAAEESAPTGAG